MCAGAIGWAQVSALVYGTADEKKGFTQYAASGVLHPKTLVKGGVMETECAKEMTDFFRKRRR
jgi:tRNA(adenine34) deaminase